MVELLNAGIFKAIMVASFVTFFRQELARIIRSCWGYINRAYPVGSSADMFNEAKGCYEGYIVKVIKYRFSLSSKKGGVTIMHPDKKPEKIKILEWLDMRKRPG